MREGYGLFELITFVTANVDWHARLIGKPLSYYEISLLDDDGAPVARRRKRRSCSARMGCPARLRATSGTPKPTPPRAAAISS